MARVLWFVSSLEQKGGGERFVLEGCKALRTCGHDVDIVCDRLSEAASFDGRYDISGVTCLNQDGGRQLGYVARSFRKLYGVFALWRHVRRRRPGIIVCQSEYDAIKVALVAGLTRVRYRVFVFGQMFQFKTDLSRYSSVFREHLETIVASRPGYRETVQMPPPRLGPLVWVVNEVISRLKYRSIRRADRVFALSSQVGWEVGLLYGRPASVVRAAFDEEFIDANAFYRSRTVGDNVRFLSVSRLVDKKRIDLVIRAFVASGVSGELRIVGIGPESDYLQSVAEEVKAGHKVKFLGAVSDESLEKELIAADCFVSMDIGDFDISVCEALAKGCRVIVATDFDLKSFDARIQGIVACEPKVQSLAGIMQAVPGMPSAGPVNIEVLGQLTWRWLAEQTAA
jgi:glycosyltransferase involved in cell wall biosynthesis